MKRAVIFSAWLFQALLPSFADLSAAPAFTVTDLRCEYRENPLGIDAAQPRLSWMLNSNERNLQQSAYQIVVASSKAKLKDGTGDWWDSGQVMSEQSVQVSYAGRPLPSHAECFWKVRAWDQDGNVSDWSRPALWTMGVLRPEDWQAQWIGRDGREETNLLTGASWIWFPGGEPEKAAPVATHYFRRQFVVPAGRPIKSVRLQFTGDNECRGWLNGQDLGVWQDFHSVKDSDLTDSLKSGTNVLAFTGRNLGTDANPAGVLGLLEIQFASGAPVLIATDAQWKVAEKEVPHWNEPGFDDAAWIAAKKLGPAGMSPWGEIRVAGPRRLPARWLRKEFVTDKKIKRATLSASGLGLSEVYVNGDKAGDHVLSPALAQYDKRVFYVTHDVTKLLRRGTNALGAVLGNGRYYADRGASTVTYGWPKLLLQLHLEFADGSVTNVVSDTSWKLTTDGPITANSEYDGEDYDARKEFIGWHQPGFADRNWEPVQLAAVPPGIVAAQMIEPIRVTQTLKPVAVTEPKPGRFVFDLGQNMVGWCRLQVSGPAGTQVTLRHAETLQPDGMLYLANLRDARVTDTYTLRGGDSETYEPRFTYHGFRYVEVSGFPGKPTLAAIEGRVVNDDLETAGTFTCSNELLNRIYTNIMWGTRGNYRSIPTDCPQRDERQGWLGDRSEESKGESYLFNIAPLYAKWLQDMADAQKPSGSVADVAPAYWPIYSDNVTWPSSSIIIPSMLERQYADAQIVARHYDSAKRWMDHMQQFVTNGLIAKDSYGDWCVPPEGPALIHSKDPARKTDPTLLATAYFYRDLWLMERYAQALGKTNDAAAFHAQAETMKAAFNEKFLDRKLGQYDNGTQTSCVLPLAFGLVPDDQRERVFNHLVKKITVDTKGHIGTGLIGGQFLNRVLSLGGRPDLCFTIATQKDYPGWGYMVAHGATTIWELWNGDTADPAMNSGNHVMLVGDLVIWLYENLAGIKCNPEQPGFKGIIMRPTPVGDLKFVKASFRSPHGLIASEWHQDGNTFDWQITVPANTTAAVFVPAKQIGSVTEGGRPANLSAGVQFLGMENGFAIFRVGSGSYHFVSK